MDIPKTYHAWHRTTTTNPANKIKLSAETLKRWDPCSDCAADVIAVRSAVSDFQAGDRVSVMFDLNSASCIRCAGVTAWLCLHPLLTIPSTHRPDNAKLASIIKLAPGKTLGYNYNTEPDQPAAVMHLTGGKGVDVVINNTGPANIPADIASLRSRKGVINIVRLLKGLTADWKLGVLLRSIGQTASMQGIGVGSKLDFMDLNRFLEERQVKPEALLDRVFEYLYSGRRVGEVVISVL
ncbi:hypothetical protein QBC46DRAFT_366966 [Diplogelasinospora grovesii]|uniref:Uncharacterized protein n=1 Tax=Diplogelasinospora grovesii TaxID=303347 RepID=A0AAN6S0W9_9PEZI|nr:hypothetical protein QBC46DRAFT_366966 [Diplogelasinospora grovesii]